MVSKHCPLEDVLLRGDPVDAPYGRRDSVISEVNLYSTCALLYFRCFERRPTLSIVTKTKGKPPAVCPNCWLTASVNMQFDSEDAAAAKDVFFLQYLPIVRS